MPKFNFCRCVNSLCNAKYHKVIDPELREMIRKEAEIFNEKQRNINNLLKTKDVDKIINGIIRLV
jgi:hypothetical protein